MNKNKFHDDAMRRDRRREILGGLILFALMLWGAGVLLIEIDKMAAKQEMASRLVSTGGNRGRQDHP